MRVSVKPAIAVSITLEDEQQHEQLSHVLHVSDVEPLFCQDMQSALNDAGQLAAQLRDKLRDAGVMD